MSVLENNGGDDGPGLRHEWVLVLVVPASTREAERLLSGERRTFTKLDTSDRESCRSSAVMCAVCKYAPGSMVAMLTACPGVP